MYFLIPPVKFDPHIIIVCYILSVFSDVDVTTFDTGFQGCHALESIPLEGYC